jgi:dTDP-4-amino-4,6-dideoxygalactose transaminase
MKTERLALLGGPPVISRPFELFRSIGDDEVREGTAVLRSGVLSAYIGAAGKDFMGGPRVLALEKQAGEYFGVRHAIAVNSWTSGLIAAVGAIGIEPGDEIITSPWTMAATATAILHFNGIPVFADIDPVSFNIDPASVERAISPRTRAVLAVDIFGQSADMNALRELCARRGLKLISDTAQAPGARHGDAFAGTLADIGGYSLNYHKHIHCGEGGILVTDDDRLAMRLRLIRNHAEAVVRSDDPMELCNLLGYNFRMGEIEAAVASVQLTKLADRVAGRQIVARRIDAGLADFEGLQTPVVSAGCTHVYYVYGMKLDTQRLGVPRERIADALRAEGVPGLVVGYQNLHRLPMFRHRIAYGTRGFPWTSPYASREVSYDKGICPVAEELHDAGFMGLSLCMCEYPAADVDLLLEAFRKVWANLPVLRSQA